jgi:ATPase subunit of ABC transporter with duplicated ATPase domains
MLGVKPKKGILDRYNELAMNYSDETAEEMAKLQDEIDAKNLWDLDSQVEQAMDALNCPPDDSDVSKLSGGERRRVALCKLLLEQPDLLLLDEPTNHLDAETVNWLEGHLRNYPGAILIVTHDRYFLDNVTGWILELDRGRGIPYEGNYSAWLKQKQKRLEQEGREEEARQRALARRIRVDRLLAQGASGQVQGAYPALRGSRRQAVRQGADDGADHHSGRRAAWPKRHRFRKSVEGFRRQAADRRSVVQAAAGGIVGVIGPERRRQDHLVPHDHRAGEAGWRRSRSASR